MDSETDIVNLALGEIGAKRINSLADDSTEEALHARLHYPHLRDGLLRSHQWNFAQLRTGLSPLADAPRSEWDTAWQLPADCVRFIRICTADPDQPWQRFALEGHRTLLTTGLDEVEILYVSNTIPPAEFDPLFTEALKLKLAAALAGPITGDIAKGNSATEKLQALALPAAFTADAREVNSGENMTPRQLAARSGLVRSRGNRAGMFYPGAPT